MKKTIVSAIIGTALALPTLASANAASGVGVAVNYGLISGPAFELTYPINDLFQVRGALSTGMSLSETSNDTDVNYKVKADGGVHRLSMDYHPFAGSFFLSAGYAFNDFKLKANASETNPTIDGKTINGNVNIKGAIEWDSAPMLSLGWGHSPAEGWGAMFEIGAIFTGTPDISLKGTTDTGSQSDLDEALKAEERKLKKDVANYDFLPVLQAGITYRF